MCQLLALDLSITSTGLVSGNRDNFEALVIKSKSKSGPTFAERLDRYEKVASQIVNHAFKVAPTTIYIEGPGGGYRGHAIYLPEFCGIVKYQLWQFFDDIVEVPPKQLKKWTTGNGNATKTLMARWVKKRWDQTFKTTDEVDAFALFQYGLELCGKE